MIRCMLTASARLLRLLSLLQVRSDWTGSRLADELDVTARTVRYDVERLRSLGYPVQGTAGVAGGYRLGAGTSLPPLMLADDEAVAVAVALHTAADRGVSGIDESARRALAKLEQLLPARLRPRVEALQSATVSIGGGGPRVAPEVLAAIAAAVRAHERLRFDYQPFEGPAGLRQVEPHRLVHTRGRWYLVAWDVDRNDWRTFRADRIQPREHRGPRFRARPDPGGDLIAYIEKGLGTATWRYRARVKVHAPAEQVAARVPPAVVIEPIDADSCLANVGSDSPHDLALWVGMIDADVEVDPGSELAREFGKLAERYARAAR